jgi:hypothetical protein
MKHKQAGPGRGVNRKTPKGYQKKVERQRKAQELASRFEKGLLKQERAELERSGEAW